MLANPPLEAAGEVFQGEWAGSTLRPHGPEARSPMAPAPGQPCPDLPGIQGYFPMKWQAAGCVSDIPGRLTRFSPARAFPLGLGLS